MPLSLSLCAEGSRQTCGETNTPPLRGGRLSFPLDYNDLLRMGLGAGLISGLAPSWRRDRLNGIDQGMGFGERCP
jgi:hypothetical protein